jgi:uncharacterized protein YerC
MKRKVHRHRKLTPAQVAAIRKDTRLLKQIAPEYGVSTATIQRVRPGRGK